MIDLANAIADYRAAMIKQEHLAGVDLDSDPKFKAAYCQAYDEGEEAVSRLARASAATADQLHEKMMVLVQLVADDKYEELHRDLACSIMSDHSSAAATEAQRLANAVAGYTVLSLAQRNAERDAEARAA